MKTKNIPDLIINAIENKKRIRVLYSDDADTRTILPHVLYKNKKGNLTLDAYQIEGYSATAFFPEWRMFTIDKIKKIEVLDTPFVIISTYNANSPKYEQAISKIS